MRRVPSSLGVAALALSSLPLVLLGCAPAARPSPARGAADAAPPAAAAPGTMLVFPDGALVQLDCGDANVAIPLAGKNITRAKLNPPRPELLALFVDGALYQVVQVESRIVTSSYDGPADLLERHRLWELAHWQRKLGTTAETRRDPLVDARLGPVSLWSVEWPQSVRVAQGVNATSQLFLSFVVSGQVITVSTTVMAGQSEAERMDYLRNVARAVVVRPGPLDHAERQRWLDEHGWKRSEPESGY